MTSILHVSIKLTIFYFLHNPHFKYYTMLENTWAVKYWGKLETTKQHLNESRIYATPSIYSNENQKVVWERCTPCTLGEDS